MFNEDQGRDEDTLIMSDDQFMNGNPIVRGTRVTVEQILLELARGRTVEQVLDEYPQLTFEGIKAALQFAAESVRFDHVTPSNTLLDEEEREEDSHRG